MADLYIGKFGKKEPYFVIQTNFEDHKSMIQFDGSRFQMTDDGLLVGLSVTSMDGLNKKSVCEFPCFMQFLLHTKPYEYEAFTNGEKVKATIEPTAREKLLYWFLTDEKFTDTNFEANQGKGGFISFGASANDTPILNGDGNAKKHQRFVLEFDDEIKPFDMTGDEYKLDASSATAKKQGYSKPSETTAEIIRARENYLASLAVYYAGESGTPRGLMNNASFLIHASLVLNGTVPNFANPTDF